jgi:cobalamin biosynthesis Mg chelatase CobN
MHQTNLTEMFRQRHLALLREAEDRRLRATRSQRSSRTKTEDRPVGTDQHRVLQGLENSKWREDQERAR